MTAHQESNESKDAQKDAWHVSRLFAFILFQVNLLQADGIMAKHSPWNQSEKWQFLASSFSGGAGPVFS
jgi:hypothetical protein